jgi:hypothetical protein
MIRTGGHRFCDKIMHKQNDKAALIHQNGSRSSAVGMRSTRLIAKRFSFRKEAALNSALIDDG